MPTYLCKDNITTSDLEEGIQANMRGWLSHADPLMKEPTYAFAYRVAGIISVDIKDLILTNGRESINP